LSDGVDFFRSAAPIRGSTDDNSGEGQQMKHRGETYRQWCDPILHHQAHEETLDDGTCLEVQTRLSRTGETQLFIGVYRRDGSLVRERVYSRRPGETMSRALVWGVGYARRVAVAGDAVRAEAAGGLLGQQQ